MARNKEKKPEAFNTRKSNPSDGSFLRVLMDHFYVY